MATYPSVSEFKRILVDQDLDSIVKHYLFAGLPFVFRKDPTGFDLMRKHLCDELSLNLADITVVGSAKIGFSLSPYNFPRSFTSTSDIDVVVVDSNLFDEVWFTMLRWHYPRRTDRLPETDWTWKIERANELYWGWFLPDRIRFSGLSFPGVLAPLRDISVRWFNAFQSLSVYPQLASWRISGRLYRTWDHAREYHRDGLRQIRDRIAYAKGES